MSKHSFVIFIVIVALVAALFTVFSPSGESKEPLVINEVISKIKAGEVQHILVEGKELTITTVDGEEWESTLGSNTDFLEVLRQENVDLTAKGAPNIEFKEGGGLLSSEWSLVLIQFLPLILFGGLLVFLLRRAQQGGANQAMGFAKSKAKMFTANKPTDTFSDVAGVEEAKEELQEVVEFLKYPDKFSRLGARVPKGVLLVGPAGGGKTLLSRAVAGEADTPFFSISGSEFVEMFVGVGASRVRDLFDQAKRNSPAIIFIDEIDAVGRHRGAGVGGGHDEREQTLNQILTEMDGFEANTNIIILAATNRPDILDPALLRPGRFDRRVVLDQADINGRKEILQVHIKGKTISQEVDLEAIAKQTAGFSGADLSHLVNEAAILAARRDKQQIEQGEFEEAIDRVIAGPQRKSRKMSAKEKGIIAYHEAGHALVARNLPNADPVHKISVIARGMMGGYTRQLPTEDRYLTTRSQFTDVLATLHGGHVAEEIMFSEMTTGAQNDIEQASKIARAMVTQYGMSEKLGPRTFGKREEMVFLGKEISEQRDYSDKLAEEIDEEVNGFIQKAYDIAKEILTNNKPKLVQIAEKLKDQETIEGKELDELFDSEAPALEPAAGQA